MRCLALANEARQRGWECTFVLRDPESDIVKLITSFDHKINKLVSLDHDANIISNMTAHSSWLPVSQSQDANETADIIHILKPNWIIVDHYSLGDLA